MVNLAEQSCPLLFGTIKEIIKGLNIGDKRPQGLVKQTGESKKISFNVNQWNTAAKCLSSVVGKTGFSNKYKVRLKTLDRDLL